MDFLDKNSKISGLQSGNRKFYSTETALLHYTDQLRKKMDEKHISVVALLYMSNAFDSIQHDNLLSKLHLLDVSASALAWFKSHLSLRKQVVRIGSDLSAHYAACDLLDHQRLGWKLIEEIGSLQNKKDELGGGGGAAHRTQRTAAWDAFRHVRNKLKRTIRVARE